MTKFVVHMFTVSDVEDPHVYAAEPIWRWENTDAGKWVIERATEKPIFQKWFDHCSNEYKYIIVADLKDRDITYFNLKWGVK